MAPQMNDFASYPSLQGRVVFISGGATGIGASLVEHFARQGSRVAFVDLQEDAGHALAASLAAEGLAKPLFLPLDLRDIDALQQAVATAGRELGGISVLVNNAARDDRHRIEEVTVAFWEDRMQVNLRHQFFAAQAVLPMMRAAGSGSIINMGSVSWHIGQGGMPAYTTAKAGIEGLTRGLARDLGPDRIRVNCIIPGWIMTQRQIDLWLTPESERELMLSQCLKEKLYPPDIARMALWLAAEDSRMCTSQTWVVDGGQSF
jgi:NAD(P)-dependent dehydrogenase (short-subunit alcohol dehydrogenase family)